MTIPLLIIKQRQEDNQIFIETNIPNPLLVLDLLAMVQRQITQEALKKMELKKEAAIITNDHAVLT